MRRALLTMFVCGGLCTGAYAQSVNTSVAPRAGAPADSALFEVLSRVEQLQSEVQQLRGVVEEQSQTIADLERKQRNMYSDLDGRVQALTPVAGTQPSAPAAQVQSGSVSSVQPQPATGVAANAAPTPPVQPVVQPVTAPAASVPVAVPPPAAENQPVTGATTNAAKGDEKERYQIAYDTLRNGHNEQAVKMFESLLTDFPAGEFSDNAQYWLGEAYKINREFDKARAAFGKVVSRYPNSSKVPDALLKIGYIEFDQQNIAKARDYLTRVTTSYPGTTAAHLAAKKLAQMPQ